MTAVLCNAMCNTFNVVPEFYNKVRIWRISKQNILVIMRQGEWTDLIRTDIVAQW